jgi:hypothetical protein
MGRNFRALGEWCYTCCTGHAPGDACPGSLLATGEERHGWRVLVATPFGVEIYGVLVASCRGLWRARILTYPNILWILPGGGSIKFVGSSPQDVEGQAIEFVKQHCKMRGLSIEQDLPTVASGAVEPEHDAAIAGALKVESRKRKVDGLPVRFGVGHVTQDAVTDNYSEDGMFIRTNTPLPQESSIQIQLELQGLRIPLSGVVQWVREADEDGRVAGMGVKIHRPPPRYIHFVRQKVKVGDNDALPAELESQPTDAATADT